MGITSRFGGWTYDNYHVFLNRSRFFKTPFKNLQDMHRIKNRLKTVTKTWQQHDIRKSIENSTEFRLKIGSKPLVKKAQFNNLNNTIPLWDIQSTQQV